MIEYYKALLKSQSEFPEIPKNKSGQRGIKYADLGDMLKTVIPILNKNGIVVKQAIITNEKSEQLIRTTMTHAESGNGDDITTLIPFCEADFQSKTAFQVYGTGFTYFKRYVLSSMLCLYADEDTDGVTGSYNSPKSYKQSNSFSKPANSDANPFG